MAGLTDQDLRRIRRFVETPPRQRTPHILTPDEGEECEGRATGAGAVLEESEGRATGAGAVLEECEALATTGGTALEASDEAEPEVETEPDLEAAE